MGNKLVELLKKGLVEKIDAEKLISFLKKSVSNDGRFAIFCLGLITEIFNSEFKD